MRKIESNGNARFASNVSLTRHNLKRDQKKVWGAGRGGKGRCQSLPEGWESESEKWSSMTRKLYAPLMLMAMNFKQLRVSKSLVSSNIPGSLI